MRGSVLGPYRIDRELGAGGMGRVFAATVVAPGAAAAEGATVALKVVHPHLLGSHGFLERFRREAEIGRAVVHPNVVRTYDAQDVEAGGALHHVLVMEMVEGQTLRGLLDELGRVPEALCRHIGRETARGIAAVHAAGAIHRDLKPENVLVTTSQAVKVMDLGVARLADEAFRLSQSGVFVGSVQYAAPEQFRRGAQVDGRADLHALGLVLYELSTGVQPFDADDLAAVVRNVLHLAPRRCAELNPQVSPFFEEVVHTLLAKDPARRFATADDLARVLDEGEAGAWWAERSRTIREETRRPLRRVRIPRETGLHGRDAEIARLRALYEAARAGDGRVVLVEGEAGIGKSRLVEEFVALLRAEGEDVEFLSGSYPPGGAATAAGAFATAYREQFGDDEAALRAALPRTPVLVPAFAALLRGDATPAGAEPLTKDSLHAAFVQATHSLAAGRPTIVLIDDLHFAPAEGRALFAAIALAAPGHRVLLVGATRPGADDAWCASLERSGAARIPLPRLGAKDLVRLLAESLRSQRLAEDLAGRVALKSDGNPFFVFEILRGLREDGFLRRSDEGAWTLAGTMREIQIPSSVLELVQARVAALSQEERDLLDIASCLGFEFDPPLLAGVAGLGRIPALKLLAQIERAHRLVRSSGRRFVFDHHQVQEALHGSLPQMLREEYHAAIGAAVERAAGADAAEPASLDGALATDLAVHFLEGGKGDRALRYAGRALGHLESRYLHDESSSLGRRLLAVPGLVRGAERCNLLLRTAEQFAFVGRPAEDAETIAEAVALAETLGDASLLARALAERGRHLAVVSRFAEAEEVLARALDLARHAGDAQAAESIALGLGNALWPLSRFDDARVCFEESLSLAVANGSAAGEMAAIGALSNLLHDLGLFDDALTLRERHLVRARELGDRRGEVVATGNVANTHLALGRSAEAREGYRRCGDMARAIGFRRGEALSLGNLAILEIGLGEPDTARELLARSIEICRAIGSLRFEASATHSLGVAARAGGDLRGALARYEEALAIRRQTGERAAIAESLSEIADVAREEGRLADARALAAEALAEGRDLHHPSLTVLASARLAAAGGTADELREALAAFAQYAQRLAVATRLEVRLVLWRATADRAQVPEIRKLLDHLVAHAPPETRATMVQRVPVLRAAAEAAGIAS